MMISSSQNSQSGRLERLILMMGQDENLLGKGREQFCFLRDGRSSPSMFQVTSPNSKSEGWTCRVTDKRWQKLQPIKKLEQGEYLFKHQRTMYELLENCNDFFNSCTFYQTVSTRYMDMSKRTGPNRQPRNCKKLSTSVCCKLCLRSRTRMNHKQLLAFFLFHKYDKSFSYLKCVNKLM